MKQTPHTLPQPIIYFFFLIGLLAAIAFRAIIVAQHIAPLLVRPLWYVAIVGNITFFSYRYAIARKRRAAVDRFDLIRKLEMREPLSDTERTAVVYLLSSIKKSREWVNYLVIFILSFIAIMADIALALQGK